MWTYRAATGWLQIKSSPTRDFGCLDEVDVLPHWVISPTEVLLALETPMLGNGISASHILQLNWNAHMLSIVCNCLGNIEQLAVMFSQLPPTIPIRLSVEFMQPLQFFSVENHRSLGKMFHWLQKQNYVIRISVLHDYWKINQSLWTSDANVRVPLGVYNKARIARTEIVVSKATFKCPVAE